MIATFLDNVLTLLLTAILLTLATTSGCGESLELDDENLLGGLLTTVMAALVFFGLCCSGVLERLLSTTGLTN